MKNSLSRLRDLDKMCRMLMKDIGDVSALYQRCLCHSR